MAEVLQVDPLAPQPERIAHAAGLIRQGSVVAIPTDTLYGLAADPFQSAAVEGVFAVKGRPESAPVLLLVDSIEMASTLAKQLPPSFYILAERFWPGPLTLVVEASDSIPALVTAGTGRVGVRLPDAAIPRALAAALGGPLTGTSANLSGKQACSNAEQVEAMLGKVLPLILDGGPSRSAVPSTVIDLRPDSWRLIREGAIPKGELEKVLPGRQ